MSKMGSIALGVLLLWLSQNTAPTAAGREGSVDLMLIGAGLILVPIFASLMGLLDRFSHDKSSDRSQAEPPRGTSPSQYWPPGYKGPRKPYPGYPRQRRR